VVKQVKTIKEKIINETTKFEPTVQIYNDVLSYFINVIDNEFVDLSIYTTKDLVPLIERLTHTTKGNPFPKYTDFNLLFYKFPCYFRRAAISSAIGKVSSYRSLKDNWLEEKNQAELKSKKFTKKIPKFQLNHNEFPVFYKGNMFERIDANFVEIKLFIKNDWVWKTIQVKPISLEKRYLLNWKVCSPKLIHIGKKYFLATSFEKEIKLNKAKIEDRIIISVDLGLTNSAVCSAMKSNGTVIDRLFINQSVEKDRLDHKLKQVKMAQKEFGKIQAPTLWRKINGLQKHIVTDTSRRIVLFAKLHGAVVIVFEFLGKMKITNHHSRMKEKLHHWSKIGVQNKTEELAHYLGIRISRINPKNTSKLAFDGSGEVKRTSRKDLAVFPTGKQYHADLNASYNIGARYFIRGFLKTISEKKQLILEAKVPLLSVRTQQTLSTLISVHQAIKPTA
jgi:IS605 OrfB family transposase